MATFDPLSGIMLWREQRLAAAARKRAIAELYPEGDALGGENPPDLRGLRLGARHAAAAYGSLAAILQNNSMQDKAHGFVGAVQAAFVSGDGDAAATKATVAAAKAAGVARRHRLRTSGSPFTCLPRRTSPSTATREPWCWPSAGRSARPIFSPTRAARRSLSWAGGRTRGWSDPRTRWPRRNFPPRRERSGGEFGIRVSHHGTLHMGAGVAAILAMLLRSGDEDVLAAISAGSEAARSAGASRRRG